MSLETVRFCGRCGAARDATGVRFCPRCGAEFAPTGPLPAIPLPPMHARSPLADARRRPRSVVGLLGLFGSAAYGFFWLWMSWRELKRIRGDTSMRPFWHAFAIFFVPLYGLFRLHAHFRTIDEHLKAGSVPVRAGAGLLTLVFFLLLTILYGGLVLGIAAASTNAPASLAPLSIFVVGGAYAYMVGTGQDALNAYYRSVSGIDIPERAHALEYLFIALFGLGFLAQIYISVSAA